MSREQPAGVDVVIPAHPKDFAVARRAVRSALRRVTPLRRVLVVAPEPFAWRGHGVQWIPEPGHPFPSLADVRARWSREQPGGESRASWLYQQMLKLGVSEYIDDLSSTYLVLDSDVLLLRPVRIAQADGVRFPFSRAFEYHAPYRAAYVRLFGRPPGAGFSLTGHHMVYDRGLVAEMMAEIEERHGVPWHAAFMDAVDYRESSSISEMDTYGWWVLDRHPEVAAHHQLHYVNVPVVPGPVGRAMFARDFDFVAAHAWMRAPRWRRGGATVRRLVNEISSDLRWRWRWRGGSRRVR